MDRYLSPSRTAPLMQMLLLSFTPRFTRTNHALAKRPAPVPANGGPGCPRKRPRPVDMDDKFVHTWYASMEKEIQEAANVAESYSDGYIFFQHAFEFQQSFKLHIWLNDDSKFTSTTSVLH